MQRRNKGKINFNYNIESCFNQFFNGKNLPIITNNILDLITFFNSVSTNKGNVSSENVLNKLKTISNFNQSQNDFQNSPNIKPYFIDDINDDMENEFIKRYQANLYNYSSQPHISEKINIEQLKNQKESKIITSQKMKSPFGNNTSKTDDDSKKFKYIIINKYMTRDNDSKNENDFH